MFALLFAYLLFSTLSYPLKGDCDTKKKFTEAGIVPYIIPEPPPKELHIRYEGKPISCGEDIDVTLTRYAPTVNYSAVDTDFYALVMVDPDAPFPDHPVFAQFLHWFIVNIPGGRINDGKVLAEYSQPSPPSNSAAHRYVFLVFLQSSYILNASYMLGHKRTKFDIGGMRKEMVIREVSAGNFYYGQKKMN